MADDHIAWPLWNGANCSWQLALGTQLLHAETVTPVVVCLTGFDKMFNSRVNESVYLRALPDNSSIQAKPSPCLPQQGDQILMQSYTCPDSFPLGWQEREPSPGMPISFTQQNPILPPPSPVSFSDYFGDSSPRSRSRQERELTPISRGNTISPPPSPSLSALFDSLSPLVELPPIQGPNEYDRFNQMLGSQTQDLRSHSNFGSSASSSQASGDNGYPRQPNELASHHQHLAQNHKAQPRKVSKDQRYRLRLKAKEQKKDEQLTNFRSELAMKHEQLLHLISESGMKDMQLALLKSELASKDERIACLMSEIEMLTK
ncbi:hypothetical protein V6N13_023916 [Hibiscus sabdariffa]